MNLSSEGTAKRGVHVKFINAARSAPPHRLRALAPSLVVPFCGTALLGEVRDGTLARCQRSLC